MQINKVTITGADDKVQVKHLVELQTVFPFVEWGILLSKSKVGEPRYPTWDWINNAVPQLKNRSSHFCGWYSRTVLENRNIPLLDQIFENFHRVQLNYNFGINTKWDIEPVTKDIMLRRSDRAIILQVNKSNKKLIDDIASMIIPLTSIPGHKNIHFLYDASGGRGKSFLDGEEKIKGPFQNYTGYSGGIDADNIETVCHDLSVHPKGDEIWIDMESGVRTDNQFDLDKVWKVLETASIYIKK